VPCHHCHLLEHYGVADSSRIYRFDLKTRKSQVIRIIPGYLVYLGEFLQTKTEICIIFLWANRLNKVNFYTNMLKQVIFYWQPM
jgi:hypothetical protein